MLCESDIHDAVIWACEQEVMAPKPGNVNCFSAGHNMQVNDFLLSAKAIAPVMAAPGLSVGERINLSINATREVVSSNTNLGIVLLFAPLCCAVENSHTPEQLTEQLKQTLLSLTIHDARLCYQAIRKAEAGGLGNAADQDISAEPTVSLLQAMKLAENRDQIALQYTTNYRDIWQISLPALTTALKSGESLEWATAFAYLKMLSDQPDSLICRKQSIELATAVTHKAQQIVFDMKKNSKLNAYSSELRAWDNELKQNAINPGSTADIVAATLLVYAFQERLSNTEFQYHDAFGGRH